MSAESLSLFANLCVCTNVKLHKSKQQFLKNKIDNSKIINGMRKNKKLEKFSVKGFFFLNKWNINAIIRLIMKGKSYLDQHRRDQ